MDKNTEVIQAHSVEKSSVSEDASCSWSEDSPEPKTKERKTDIISRSITEVARSKVGPN